MNRKKAEKAAKSVARAGTRSVSSIIFFILKIIGTVLLVTITTGVMFACIFAFYIKSSIQSQLGVTFEEYQMEETSYLYCSNGGSEGDSENARVWSEIKSSVQRTWVDYEEIPQYMLDAVVAIEDKRFYEHDGVDWYRTVGAFYTMFFGEGDSSFGASTITQQLIKNLTDYDDVTVKRKIVEIFRALEAEKFYSKEEVLAWYLNIVFFGEKAYGVQAAAQTYFGKDVGELSLAECACIIGITNRPTRYNPYISKEENKTRQETILEEMYNQGYITYDQYTEAVAEDLIFVTKSSNDDDSPVVFYTYYQEAVINDVIEGLMEEKDLSEEAAKQRLFFGGLHIYACVNLDVQQAVDDIYTDLSQIPSASGGGEQQFQSAITIQDPKTGYIVALCGGVGEKTTNFGFNRATDAERPPGSSIKPLSVYGPALDNNIITPDSTYEDSPITVNGKKWPNNDSGKWTYANYNITTAVQKSVNTIAVRVCEAVGTDVSYYYLTEKLGLTTLVEDDGEGHTDIALAPLALGQLTTGATVREMTSAYCAIANRGVYTDSKTYYLVKDSQGDVVLDNSEAKSSVAFKEETANTLTELLYNAVRTGTGTDAKLSSGMAAAGKTGTTGDKKDRWFCGFTPYYVAAVWTGYDTPKTISTSGNPAAKLWNKVMAKVNEYLGLPVITKFDTGVTITGKVEQGEESPSPTESAEPSESPSAEPSESSSEEPSESPSDNPSSSSSPTTPTSSSPTTSPSSPPVTSPSPTDQDMPPDRDGTEQFHTVGDSRERTGARRRRNKYITNE